jgi:hypothetical protein
MNISLNEQFFPLKCEKKKMSAGALYSQRSGSGATYIDTDRSISRNNAALH